MTRDIFGFGLEWFARDLRQACVTTPSRAPAIPTRPSKRVSSLRVSEGWERCLRCDSTAQYSRFGGLCKACRAAVSPTDREWFRGMVDRWRKWSVTRYRESDLFIASPDPWQVTLYGLGRLMLGFETTLGMEGGPRAGLDEILGVPAREIYRACRGTAPLSAEAKAKLVEVGPKLTRLWSEGEEEEAEEVD